jgi:hypothetical protein
LRTGSLSVSLDQVGAKALQQQQREPAVCQYWHLHHSWLHSGD